MYVAMFAGVPAGMLPYRSLGWLGYRRQDAATWLFQSEKSGSRHKRAEARLEMEPHVRRVGLEHALFPKT
jgi:hypothetical protein